ncbi:hypothetical protein [Butyricimonas virosa]|jgi:hypothetical protein|uniref:hypothetical protein n=1 Tax=Butyricimonas virosa TaxID=544645 RepID=UPI00307CADB7
MRGLKYLLRFLRGESPESIIKSMPEEDFNKIKGFAQGIDKRALNRAQRRRLEKQLAKLNR